MMRSWRKQTWLDGDKRVVHGYRVRCCECGDVSEVRGQEMGERIAREAMPQKFRERGWQLGKREDADRCRLCAARNAKRSEQLVEGVKARPVEPATPVVLARTVVEETMNVSAKSDVKAEVRTPTREQRRRVMEALDDVYPHAEKGYAGNMTDELLARRLDVPRAWVSEVREQLYGPEVVVDVKGFATRVAMLEQQVKEFETRALEQADQLNRQLAQAVRELEAMSAKVVRAA